MANPFILVAPSTRGISLALTRHFLRTTTLPVYATHRSGDSASVKQDILSTLTEHSSSSSPTNASTNKPESHTSESLASRLHLLPLDLAVPQSIADAASLLAEMLPKNHDKDGDKDEDTNSYSYLHTGFFTGGVLHVEKRPQDFDMEKMKESFQVNTLAHMLLMKHFERFLPKAGTEVMPLEHYHYPPSHSPSSSPERKGKDEDESKRSASSKLEGGLGLGKKDPGPGLAKWVHITARVGSIADNTSGGWYSYRASKAALAQLVRTFDHHLRMRRVPAVALGVHPGTVRTGFARAYLEGAEKRMREGRGRGEVLDAEEAARRLVGVVGRAGERERGMVWDHRGERVPW